MGAAGDQILNPQLASIAWRSRRRCSFRPASSDPSSKDGRKLGVALANILVRA